MDLFEYSHNFELKKKLIKISKKVNLTGLTTKDYITYNANTNTRHFK